MPAKSKTAQGKADNQKKPKVVEPKKTATKAVAEKPAPKKTPIKKSAKKKPTDKNVAITRKQFEAWFLKLDHDHFMHYAEQWNKANLHVEIPKLDGYDEWLNFFKDLSPTIIRQLAVTGLDFLPTDGYAALSLWHDIISHPQRIGKIYQAGLTKKRGGKDHKTIVELAQSNDRLGVLKATRDEIAAKLQKGAGARDTAALARELTEVMTQIADYEKRQGPKKSTKLGQLLGDVDLRKRPGRNGGGARNTSFKSRVTIKDVEGTA